MRRAPHVFSLAILLLLVLAGPAAAASPDAAIFGGYWQSCLEWWQSSFQKQNGVVMGVLGVGAVALLIITRSGKWQK
jgi:hypothetical protein